LEFTVGLIIAVFIVPLIVAGQSYRQLSPVEQIVEKCDSASYDRGTIPQSQDVEKRQISGPGTRNSAGRHVRVNQSGHHGGPNAPKYPANYWIFAIAKDAV
jgi:hypothetical protein